VSTNVTPQTNTVGTANAKPVHVLFTAPEHTTRVRVPDAKFRAGPEGAAVSAAGQLTGTSGPGIFGEKEAEHERVRKGCDIQADR
jgi:hypothetical protein